MDTGKNTSAFVEDLRAFLRLTALNINIRINYVSPSYWYVPDREPVAAQCEWPFSLVRNVPFIAGGLIKLASASQSPESIASDASDVLRKSEGKLGLQRIQTRLDEAIR